MTDFFFGNMWLLVFIKNSIVYIVKKYIYYFYYKFKIVLFIFNFIYVIFKCDYMGYM